MGQKELGCGIHPSLAPKHMKERCKPEGWGGVRGPHTLS